MSYERHIKRTVSRRVARDVGGIIRKMCLRGHHCWDCLYECHNCGSPKSPRRSMMPSKRRGVDCLGTLNDLTF